MPYEWVTPLETDTRTDSEPLAELHLWPYRSLPRKGFVIFIGITAGLILLPLLAVIGTAVLWGLLPFIVITVGLMWVMLERSYKQGDIIEVLTLTPDSAHLHRRNPKGDTHEWDCNIYWVQVSLHPKGGPVPNYVTLKGSGREVEIGAFLSEEERKALYEDLLVTIPRASLKRS